MNLRWIRGRWERAKRLATTYTIHIHMSKLVDQRINSWRSIYKVDREIVVGCGQGTRKRRTSLEDCRE